jgi:hypothetical protein
LASWTSDYEGLILKPKYAFLEFKSNSKKIIGKMLPCFKLKYMSLLGMGNIHMPYTVDKTVGKLPPPVQSVICKIHIVYHSLFVLILHKFKTHITVDYLPDFHTSVVDKTLLLRHNAESLGE